MQRDISTHCYFRIFCNLKAKSGMFTMAIWVMEFSNGLYFFLRINIPKGNFWILKIGLTGSFSSLQKPEFLKLIILILAGYLSQGQSYLITAVLRRFLTIVRLSFPWGFFMRQWQQEWSMQSKVECCLLWNIIHFKIMDQSFYPKSIKTNSLNFLLTVVVKTNFLFIWF